MPYRTAGARFDVFDFSSPHLPECRAFERIFDPAFEEVAPLNAPSPMNSLQGKDLRRRTPRGNIARPRKAIYRT